MGLEFASIKGIKNKFFGDSLLLAQIRNWYGLWSVLVSGGLVLAATWWLPPEGQAAYRLFYDAEAKKLSPQARAVVQHADEAGVVGDRDVDLVLLVLAGVLHHVRARLGERQHDLLDRRRGHVQVLQRLPQQPPHQGQAARVPRKADAERDVHGRAVPSAPMS